MRVALLTRVPLVAAGNPDVPGPSGKPLREQARTALRVPVKARGARPGPTTPTAHSSGCCEWVVLPYGTAENGFAPRAPQSLRFSKMTFPLGWVERAGAPSALHRVTVGLRGSWGRIYRSPALRLAGLRAGPGSEAQLPPNARGESASCAPIAWVGWKCLFRV